MSHHSIRILKWTLCCGWLCIGLARAADDLPLEVGHQVPEFQALDDQGQTWNSGNLLGKRLLVVYFYPSDFSFCCTRQAQRYRDRLRDFRIERADVVGISGDALEAHRRFQATHQLGFSLLSDQDGQIARQFGVPLRMGGKAMIADKDGKTLVDDRGHAFSVPRRVTDARYTFVIDENGRLIYRNSEVAPVKDSQEVLEFIRQHRAKEAAQPKN